MKSKPLNIFISALFALSAFFFGANFCSAEEELSQYVNHPATISALVGRVEVWPKGGSSWQEAEIGLELTAGDKIRTTEGAKAELVFEDGSFIRMKQKTTLGVETARQNVSDKSTNYNLDLRVGELMLELKKLKKGSSFEVQTPTAVAAVRGTTYYMRTGTRLVDGVEKAFVEIYVDSDDIILFTNTVSGQSSIVTQGAGAIVYDDGTSEGPYEIPPAAQDAWKSGFDMVYDDSDQGKKGMRDEGEEEDDTGEDVDDTTDSQNDAQSDANKDQTGEQDITGLAKVDIITDSDGDGVPDLDDLFPNDPNRASGNDLDGDGIDDEFDPNDNDGPLGDLDGDGVANQNDLFPNDPNRASGNDLDGDGIDDEFDNDIDGDGYSNAVDEFPRDFWEYVDTDSDTIGDFEDAFPQDNTIDPDSAFDDIDGNPVTVAGYGSRDELRQAAIDNLLAIQGLRQDISDMIGDIQARQFEAVKEEIFDHQAAKVMTDRWGNRVRVEEYVSKPTNDQVQILALNLRTGGPNAGISSLDFQVKFDRDISDTTLRELPWGDYMSNPIVGDYQQLPQGTDQDAQLIVYENGEGFYNPADQGYPLPENFSLEVKNPYAESVRIVETYSDINAHPGGNPNIWYQLENNSNIYINDLLREDADGDWDDDWGDGWNQANRFTFLEEFADDSWLMGVFYLINDDGSLVPIPASAADLAAGDYLDEINGIRDCINPDFNLEMVFLSSEFTGTDVDLPGIIAEQGTPGEVYERQIYNSNRTIDVITIPEITEPYYGN